MAIVGYQTIGASTEVAGSTSSANNPTGLLVTMTEAGCVLKMTAYVNVTTGTDFCACSIYSGTASNRGTLLTTSENVNISTSFSWLDFVFDSGVTLTAGTYWLQFNSVGGNGVGTPVGQINYDTGGATDTGYRLSDIGNPLYNTQRYSIYLTYGPPISGGRGHSLKAANGVSSAGEIH